MEMTWDLNKIYTSLDSEEYKRDKEFLDNYINKINQWTNENLNDNGEASRKVEEFLKLSNKYRNVYQCLTCYAYLLISANGDDSDAMDALDELEDKNCDLTKSFVRFSSWLCSLPNLEDIINSSSYILDHKFYLNQIVAKEKYMLNENEEEIIAMMQSTGSKAWQRLYMELSSTLAMDVDINGEKHKLSFGELKNMAYEKDSLLRKAAHDAQIKGCESICNTAAACINGIMGEAIIIYDKKGYVEPVNKVLFESRMNKETLDSMVSAIKESLPIFRQYYKKKKELLGHKSKLPFYDVYAPISKGEGKISYTEGKELIVAGFKKFSEELGCFAEKAFNERWIDAEPRTGKGNYGLCVDIFPIKESRIMTNFSGNYVDVNVLAHEIGHAYHSYCIRNEEVLNTDYPTPIAETASIFCETIMNNELLEIVPREEKLSILEKRISDSAYYIVDMYGRFLFESEVFERRKLGPLSVEELNEIMKKSIKEAYGEIIDEETINEYSWVNNFGFYMAGNEFLNFPYIFGILFSKGLYGEYIRMGKEFVEKYENLLKVTSKNNVEDIAKFMNINISSIDFWKEALKTIESDINLFIESCEN